MNRIKYGQRREECGKSCLGVHSSIEKEVLDESDRGGRGYFGRGIG